MDTCEEHSRSGLLQILTHCIYTDCVCAHECVSYVGVVTWPGCGPASRPGDSWGELPGSRSLLTGDGRM